MRRRMRCTALRCLLGASLLAGCSGSPAPRHAESASDAFLELSRVVLEDSPIATIGQLRDFVPYGEEFLVADGMTDRVMAFSANGEFERAVGRQGDGPGEFKTPVSLLVDADSSIVVADLSGRLTRLSPQLEVAKIYRVDVPLWVQQLADVDGRILLYQPSGRTARDNFAWWDPGSGLGESFDRVNEVLRAVPYWSATWRTLLAAGQEDLFVADNMVYPLRRLSLSGELEDTLGYAPPSWRQADKPELGEFATPEGQRRGQGWMRSFTTIDGLFTVGTDWLVVTHRDPVGQYHSDDVIRADVCRVDSLRKVWEDVQLPGPMVRGGDCAWVLVASPPDPWAIACWVPRPPGVGPP